MQPNQACNSGVNPFEWNQDSLATNLTSNSINYPEAMSDIVLDGICH